MIINQDFERLLNRKPHDQETRLLYADMIEEQAVDTDDMILAAGMRWLAKHDKHPKRHQVRYWTFQYRKNGVNTPDNIYDIAGYIGELALHNSRREAELELSKALYICSKIVIGLPP